MATDATYTVDIAAGTDPGWVIREASSLGNVVECTGADGSLHSFVLAVPEADLWAARCTLNTRSKDSRTWVVDQQREDTIENCIRRCDPDVRLVPESDSEFAQGGSEDA